MGDTLLVAIDSTAASRRAVQSAAAIVRSSPGTKLVLLNVQQDLERRFVHGLTNRAARQQLTARGQRETADTRALLDRFGCSYEFVIVFGNPAETIVRVAREKRCSAIVMGGRGLGRLRSFFLGSTSHAVRRSANVPVTVVG